jgi:hypothetical protein
MIDRLLGMLILLSAAVIASLPLALAFLVLRRIADVIWR